MDMDSDTPKIPAKSPKQMERERAAERRAKALRDNLRRRKSAGKAVKDE